MRAVHLMRAHADAIMVGVGTVLADDPLLDRAPAGAGGPLAGPRRRRHPPAHAAERAGSSTAPARFRPGSSPASRRRSRRSGRSSRRASRSCGSRRTTRGRVGLPEALAAPRQRAGITRVFCEGGPALADALAQRRSRRRARPDHRPVRAGRRATCRRSARRLQDRMDALDLRAEEQIGPDLFMFWERP